MRRLCRCPGLDGLEYSVQALPTPERPLPHAMHQIDTVLESLRNSILQPSLVPLDQALKPVKALLDVQSMHTDPISAVRTSTNPGYPESLSLDSSLSAAFTTQKMTSLCAYSGRESYHDRLQRTYSVLAYPASQKSSCLPPETAQVALKILSGDSNPFECIPEGERIGRGMFAEVKKVTVNGQVYAAKIPLPGRLLPHQLDQEYHYLSTLKHPHIVTVLHIDYPILYIL